MSSACITSSSAKAKPNTPQIKNCTDLPNFLDEGGKDACKQHANTAEDEQNDEVAICDGSQNIARNEDGAQQVHVADKTAGGTGIDRAYAGELNGKCQQRRDHAAEEHTGEQQSDREQDGVGKQPCECNADGGQHGEEDQDLLLAVQLIDAERRSKATE